MPLTGENVLVDRSEDRGGLPEEPEGVVGWGVWGCGLERKDHGHH